MPPKRHYTSSTHVGRGTGGPREVLSDAQTPAPSRRKASAPIIGAAFKLYRGIMPGESEYTNFDSYLQLERAGAESAVLDTAYFRLQRSGKSLNASRNDEPTNSLLRNVRDRYFKI
jgi:hypothetical protein